VGVDSLVGDQRVNLHTRQKVVSANQIVDLATD
jgi:hypothetical protein